VVDILDEDLMSAERKSCSPDIQARTHLEWLKKFQLELKWVSGHCNPQSIVTKKHPAKSQLGGQAILASAGKWKSNIRLLRGK
jgi:hypothetical protein